MEGRKDLLKVVKKRKRSAIQLPTEQQQMPPQEKGQNVQQKTNS